MTKQNRITAIVVCSAVGVGILFAVIIIGLAATNHSGNSAQPAASATPAWASDFTAV